MPSLNHYTKIHDARRIRVNVCEGEVHVQLEDLIAGGRWQAVAGSHIGPLKRGQAEALANTILGGLKAGY